MKKRVSIWLTILCTFMLCIGFASCNGVVSSSVDSSLESSSSIEDSSSVEESSSSVEDSSSSEESSTDVAIIVENATEGQTLLSYMETLQADGEITFSVRGGLLVTLNGTSNTTKSYWMLYTTDADNSNEAWGTYVYNGETLASSMYGVESLVVKNGETYIWTYQTF